MTGTEQRNDSPGAGRDGGWHRMPNGDRDRPHVVVVGAGFAGLACARELGGAPLRVTLIDRRNHHLFAPLLYQVATAALSPADIAEPIRRALRRHPNIDVLMEEVRGVDTADRRVLLSDGRAIAYDRLVLATGARNAWFGKAERWRPWAPGLRSIEDARDIRRRLLSAFERAEIARDPAERRRRLTVAIVGGGPTGVELAGAVAELGRHALGADYREIGPADMRVVLIEARARLLSGFPERLAAYARQALEALGVEVRLDAKVDDIGPGGVAIGAETVPAETILWSAGIAASPAGAWLGVATDAGGRVMVDSRLAVPGLEGVFVLGDTAHVAGANGEPLPGLAQVARQQGRHLGRELRRNLVDRTALRPFDFADRGQLATIGRNRAIADLPRLRLTGPTAWWLWGLLHLGLLTGPENRLAVAVRWLYHYLTYDRGARLITDEIGRLDGGRAGRTTRGRRSDEQGDDDDGGDDDDDQ